MYGKKQIDAIEESRKGFEGLFVDRVLKLVGVKRRMYFLLCFITEGRERRGNLRKLRKFTDLECHSEIDLSSKDGRRASGITCTDSQDGDDCRSVEAFVAVLYLA